MALFKEQVVRDRAAREMRQQANIYKSKSRVLQDSYAAFNRFKTYDIFLSHSSRDAELILGMKGILEDLGYSVYVDWVDDAQLDRSRVNKDTAATLRERMKTSKSLFYVTTESSVSSKWMPWECGYFDGFKEKVAIVPIEKYPYSNDYTGQEYLDLYPYCLQEKTKSGLSKLWVHKDKSHYTLYDTWVTTPNSDLRWRRLDSLGNEMIV